MGLTYPLLYIHLFKLSNIKKTIFYFFLLVFIVFFIILRYNRKNLIIALEIAIESFSSSEIASETIGPIAIMALLNGLYENKV